ncbi:MAG: hypothetical protein RL094_429 [Candidatus Parcubacteria bacterium]
MIFQTRYGLWVAAGIIIVVLAVSGFLKWVGAHREPTEAEKIWLAIFTAIDPFVTSSVEEKLAKLYSNGVAGVLFTRASGSFIWQVRWDNRAGRNQGIIAVSCPNNPQLRRQVEFIGTKELKRLRWPIVAVCGE